MLNADKAYNFKIRYIDSYILYNTEFDIDM